MKAQIQPLTYCRIDCDPAEKAVLDRLAFNREMSSSKFIRELYLEALEKHHPDAVNEILEIRKQRAANRKTNNPTWLFKNRDKRKVRHGNV